MKIRSWMRTLALTHRDDLALIPVSCAREEDEVMFLHPRNRAPASRHTVARWLWGPDRNAMDGDGDSPLSDRERERS
jgi:hypothetical protein